MEYLEVFQGFVPRVMPSTGSISSVGTASTPEYQSTLTMRTMLGVSGIFRPWVHRFDNCIPISLPKAFTDGPTSGSSSRILSGGGRQLECSRVLAVYTGSIISILLCVSSTLGVCTATIVYTRGFCTAHTSSMITCSIWAFSTARTLSLRNI